MPMAFSESYTSRGRKNCARNSGLCGISYRARGLETDVAHDTEINQRITKARIMKVACVHVDRHQAYFSLNIIRVIKSYDEKKI